MSGRVAARPGEPRAHDPAAADFITSVTLPMALPLPPRSTHHMCAISWQTVRATFCMTVAELLVGSMSRDVSRYVMQPPNTAHKEAWDRRTTKRRKCTVRS